MMHSKEFISINLLILLYIGMDIVTMSLLDNTIISGNVLFFKSTS